jgi:hypothetical protein
MVVGKIVQVIVAPSSTSSSRPVSCRRRPQSRSNFTNPSWDPDQAGQPRPRAFSTSASLPVRTIAMDSTDGLMRGMKLLLRVS